MIEELWDIPAHPLLVHFPIVLIPVFAAGAVATAIRPDWRRRFGWALAGTTLVGAGAALAAARSGKPFQEALQPGLGPLADRHADLGNQSALFAVLFLVSASATAAADRWYSTRAESAESPIGPRVGAGLAVVTAILGVVAAVWVIRTGHEGARITWIGVDVGGE